MHFLKQGSTCDMPLVKRFVPITAKKIYPMVEIITSV